MKRRKSSKKRQSKEELGQKLLGYSAAAGAALAVGSPSADAAPVSVDVNLMIGPNDFLVIDLDNDGVNDFQINLISTSTSTSTLGSTFNSGTLPGGTITFTSTFFGKYSYTSLQAAVIVGNNPTNIIANNGFTSALKLLSNMPINSLLFQPPNNASASGGLAARYFLYFSSFSYSFSFSSTPGGATNVFNTSTGTSYTSTTSYGNFIGSRGFVGLQFDISGDLHFGWIDLEVSNSIDKLTVHGYGYNDVALQQVLAGEQTAQTVPNPVPEPSSISLLALGAAGVYAMRRRKKALAGEKRTMRQKKDTVATQ